MIQELSSFVCERQSRFNFDGFIENIETDSISDFNFLFPKETIFNVKLGSNVALKVWIKNEGIGIQLFSDYPRFSDFEMLRDISSALINLDAPEHQLYAWYPSQFEHTIVQLCDEFHLQYRNFGNGFIAVKFDSSILDFGFIQTDISESNSTESVITFCKCCQFYEFCKV